MALGFGRGSLDNKASSDCWREGWTSWSASLSLSPRARCLCPSREPVTMGLTGRYLGGLGCPVASRSWRLLSQGCGTQASAQLPLSQRGASGHTEPCGGIELQLLVVSLMPSLRRTDAFGLGCPGLWCGELSLASALQACWDPVSRAQSLCLKLPLPCPLSWLWPGGVSGWLVTPRLLPLLGLLPVERGSVHRVCGKNLCRGIVSHLPQGYLVCSILLPGLS